MDKSKLITDVFVVLTFIVTVLAFYLASIADIG